MFFLLCQRNCLVSLFGSPFHWRGKQPWIAQAAHCADQRRDLLTLFSVKPVLRAKWILVKEYLNPDKNSRDYLSVKF